MFVFVEIRKPANRLTGNEKRNPNLVIYRENQIKFSFSITLMENPQKSADRK